MCGVLLIHLLLELGHLSGSLFDGFLGFFLEFGELFMFD